MSEQHSAENDRGLTEALASIKTHNGTPVTPENLRYAATHEALSRSWIFDVLTGLADALEPPPPTGTVWLCECGHPPHDDVCAVAQYGRNPICGCVTSPAE
jgi:hypothetical protein